MSIPHGLKLRHVRGFLAVAEAGSVSEAARSLHVSQPALSKTIADIEQALEQVLFDRSGRRMTLTAAGALFRRYASDAVKSLEAGTIALNGENRSTNISVGVLPTVAGRLFPSVAKDFVELRPDATVSVTTGPHGFLLDRLRQGAIDLIVGRMPTPDEMVGLNFEFLYNDPIELVARADHPSLETGVARALSANPVILPTRESIIRKIVDGFLNAQGLSAIKPRLETVSLSLSLPLLLSSDMLWFISRGVVGRELTSGNLATFDLGAGYMSGAVGITQKRSENEESNINDLIELLHIGARNLDRS
ncbi:MAG: LysR substrate-binding domain-containing protein [Cohaesibacteraceae bacterium]